jgi:hypothetical protein
MPYGIKKKSRYSVLKPKKDPQKKTHHVKTVPSKTHWWGGSKGWLSEWTEHNLGLVESRTCLQFLASSMAITSMDIMHFTWRLTHWISKYMEPVVPSFIVIFQKYPELMVIHKTKELPNTCWHFRSMLIETLSLFLPTPKIQQFV